MRSVCTLLALVFLQACTNECPEWYWGGPNIDMYRVAVSDSGGYVAAFTSPEVTDPDVRVAPIDLEANVGEWRVLGTLEEGTQRAFLSVIPAGDEFFVIADTVELDTDTSTTRTRWRINESGDVADAVVDPLIRSQMTVHDGNALVTVTFPPKGSAPAPGVLRRITAEGETLMELPLPGGAPITEEKALTDYAQLAHANGRTWVVWYNGVSGRFDALWIDSDGTVSETFAAAPAPSSALGIGSLYVTSDGGAMLTIGHIGVRRELVRLSADGQTSPPVDMSGLGIIVSGASGLLSYNLGAVQRLDEDGALLGDPVEIDTIDATIRSPAVLTGHSQGFLLLQAHQVPNSDDEDHPYLHLRGLPLDMDGQPGEWSNLLTFERERRTRYVDCGY